MQADAAPHDDRRLWPDVVDHHRGRRPLRRDLVSLDVPTCLELARFLELVRCLEMSPASVAPDAARLEKMKIPKFLQVSSRHSDKLAPFGADTRTPDNAAPMPRSCDDLGPPPLSVQMTPVPAQIMHLKASRRSIPLLSTGQRRGTARSTEKTRRHGRLFPAMNEFLRRRCGCGVDIAKRPAGERKRRSTVLPRKTGRYSRRIIVMIAWWDRSPQR